MLLTVYRFGVSECREGLIALGGQQVAFEVVAKAITLILLAEEGANDWQ